MIFQNCQLVMHKIQFLCRKGQVNISKLIRIYFEIVISNETTDKLTIQIIMGPIDIPNTGIGVGVAISTCTKRTIIPKKVVKK